MKLCCVKDCWMCSELRLYCTNCYLNYYISLFQDFWSVLSPFHCFLVLFHKALLIFWLAFLYIFKSLNMLLLSSLWDCFYYTKSGYGVCGNTVLELHFLRPLELFFARPPGLGIVPDFSVPLISYFLAFVVVSCCPPRMACFPDLEVLHSWVIPSPRWNFSQLLPQLWGWIRTAALLCLSCPTPLNLASRKRKLSVPAPPMIEFWPSLLGVPQIHDIST